MAPSCAIAQWTGADKVQVWSHCQGVYNLRADLALALGLPPENIVVQHVEGAGCYGHNGADDVAFDAVLLARAAGGRPVRVQWSREDELAWSPMGAAMAVEIEADLDAGGDIVGWRGDVWSNGHVSRPGRIADPDRARGLAARQAVRALHRLQSADGGRRRGGAQRRAALRLSPPCASPATGCSTMPIRTSALRTLGAFANVFAIESFMDELAAERGEDPLAFRLRHLKEPRARAVLEAAAKRAGWSAWRKRDGVGHGIAFARYKNFGAYCAVVAEVEGDADIRVRRLVVAVDVGEVINPDGVANQMEGGAIQATSWTLKEAVRFDRYAHHQRHLGDLSDPALLRGAGRRGRDPQPPRGEVARCRRGGAPAHGRRHRQRRVRRARRARARSADHARAHHRRHGLRAGPMQLATPERRRGARAGERARGAFKAETGCDIAGTFGAVGAMRDKLLAGAPADLLILTSALIGELTRPGHVLPRLRRRPRRRAHRRGGAQPAIRRRRSAMRQRCAPRCSRPTPSTFPTRSWRRPASTSPRCSTRSASPARWPRGCGRSPTAPPPCRRWPARRTRAPIGCTQVTEILNTPGVTLVGPLPKEFELATVYTAGVCTRAALPDQARDFAALLGSDAARAVRASRLRAGQREAGRCCAHCVRRCGVRLARASELRPVSKENARFALLSATLRNARFTSGIGQAGWLDSQFPAASPRVELRCQTRRV